MCVRAWACVKPPFSLEVGTAAHTHSNVVSHTHTDTHTHTHTHTGILILWFVFAPLPGPVHCEALTAAVETKTGQCQRLTHTHTQAADKDVSLHCCLTMIQIFSPVKTSDVHSFFPSLIPINNQLIGRDLHAFNYSACIVFHCLLRLLVRKFST